MLPAVLSYFVLMPSDMPTANGRGATPCDNFRTCCQARLWWICCVYITTPTMVLPVEPPHAVRTG